MTARSRPRSPLSPEARRAIDRAFRALGDPRARPNVAWVSRLLGVTPDALSSLFLELDELVPVEAEIRRRHLDAGRPYYAQFRAPFDLYVLVRWLRPDHVIETGVSSGVSSAHALLALAQNGRGTLHSIDQPTPQRGPTFTSRDSPVALPPGRTSGWAVPDSLRERWDLRIGPSERKLPALCAETPSVGLFLHDSLHTPGHLTFELSTVRPRLGGGSVVLADNTAWTGRAFPRFAASLAVPVLRRGRTDLVGLRVPTELDQ
jgi:Methyltransferase domain